MDPFAKQNTSKQSSQQNHNNSFANALAETEKPLSEYSKPKDSNPNSLFSEALARAGGKFGDSSGGADSVPASQDFLNNGLTQEQQAEQLRKKQQKEALRKKLHDQVNPVDKHELFSAHEKRVKEELNKTRQELAMLAKEIKSFHKEIDIETFKEVNKPGDDGTYYINFFQKLRQFIILLRQKVKSARSWANQMKTKQAKKKKKKGKKPGMEVAGQSHEQAKSVFDMMHHERSSSYSGS